ncbi:hypothetical protein [Phenylobacterium sp.]|uniref:hypothetical protein n=1 Tax=Phenylobacterium sp. TaxID=1871053 RepID=UPI00273767F7|nr:hypothetical protein [Phenylobacterium sp.]MDP3854370.1 hypothetical protein [Phenylobacterium sp.]
MPTSDSPEFAAWLAAEIQAEQWRQARADRAAARHRGVCWSGLGQGPYEPQGAEALLAEARAKFARRRAWRDSPAGGFMRAVTESQVAACAAHEAAEQARAACSRDANGEAGACAAAASELEAQARALLASAKAARRAAIKLGGPPVQSAN